MFHFGTSTLAPPPVLVLANTRVQLSYTRASNPIPMEQLTDTIIDIVALDLRPAMPDYIQPASIVEALGFIA